MQTLNAGVASKEGKVKRSIRLITKITMVATLLLLCFTFSCQQQVEEIITEEEAKALGDRYLEARNKGNLALLDDFYETGIVAHYCDQPEDIVGLDALKNYYTFSHTAFPDFNMTIDDMIVKGDKIVWLWTVTGTNTGPLGELPPTGKKVLFSGVAVARVFNGKVVEVWAFWSVLDLYQQLGFTLTPPQEQK